MTIEEQLKEYILRRYNSLREFCNVNNIPVSTVYSILRRGIDNSSISNVIKLCKILGLSVDALANGELKPINSRAELFLKDTIEITDVLAETKELLSYNGTIMLDGNPIDKKDLESIINAFDFGVEIAKRNTNKT